LKSFCIVGRDPRETSLDAADTKCIERTRNLEFLVRSKDHTDALLAVAKRCVIKLHGTVRSERFADLGQRVQLADPKAVRIR
jgi:hypothetical protein